MRSYGSKESENHNSTVRMCEIVGTMGSRILMMMLRLIQRTSK